MRWDGSWTGNKTGSAPIPHIYQRIASGIFALLTCLSLIWAGAIEVGAQNTVPEIGSVSTPENSTLDSTVEVQVLEEGLETGLWGSADLVGPDNYSISVPLEETSPGTYVANWSTDDTPGPGSYNGTVRLIGPGGWDEEVFEVNLVYGPPALSDLTTSSGSYADGIYLVGQGISVIGIEKRGRSGLDGEVQLLGPTANLSGQVTEFEAGSYFFQWNSSGYDPGSYEVTMSLGAGPAKSQTFVLNEPPRAPEPPPRVSGVRAQDVEADEGGVLSITWNPVATAFHYYLVFVSTSRINDASTLEAAAQIPFATSIVLDEVAPDERLDNDRNYWVAVVAVFDQSGIELAIWTDPGQAGPVQARDNTLIAGLSAVALAVLAGGILMALLALLVLLFVFRTRRMERAAQPTEVPDLPTRMIPTRPPRVEQLAGPDFSQGTHDDEDVVINSTPYTDLLFDTW